jgi:hypothetical protein
MSAPIIAGLAGQEFIIHPTPVSAGYAHFDARANRALHMTLTGESMAEWGPLYLRDARAVLSKSQRQGQLWERAGDTGNHETPIILDCRYHGPVGTIRDNRGQLLCQVCGGSVK